jgi:hypothetical protein|tara:strand:- start:14334 stop:14471 length:138 start_codon:yes stop_codon:yes gene_type:complete
MLIKQATAAMELHVIQEPTASPPQPALAAAKNSSLNIMAWNQLSS